MKELNINDFTIHIGSALFLDQLFKDFNLNDEQIINIYSIIENKNYDFDELNKKLIEMEHPPIGCE